ncbi:MAG TPA: hypothetical protein VKE93_05765 [Candidatus Angelobacter sp.]|nr:hypothetical protein [Candidatus Angelobacter sp.]
MTVQSFERISVGLSLTTAFAQAALAGMLLKRKTRSDFPVFLSFNAAAALTSFVLASYVAVSGSSSARYFWLYWGLNTLIMILGFGVLYEILKAGLKPYPGLIDLGKLLFRWAALFLLVAGGLAAFATVGPTTAKCLAAVQLLDRSLLMMQCGLLFLFFLLERRLSLSWRSYPVSLALGFGITAALDLTFSFLRARFPGWWGPIAISDNASGLLIVAFWITCFAVREPSRKSVLESPNKLIFQRWNETLIAHGYGSTMVATANAMDSSFLPGIEKTVDRILARKVVN